MTIFAMGLAVTSCGDDDPSNEITSEKKDKAPKGVEAVDLGVVVDGKKVLWANMNVGAESPTDYGGYFAWGETVPYGGVDESNASNYSYTGGSYTKTYYDWSTYKYCKGSYSNLTKYVPSVKASTHGYNNFYDDKTVLDPEDDAATANWGGDWRMPTHAEQLALKKQCEWTWVTTYNGKSVKGYIVTGNGHEIFLPAAGYRYDSSPNFVGSFGNYWSSSLYESNSDFAWCLYFNSGFIDPDFDDTRCYGRSVRPVRAAQN